MRTIKQKVYKFNELKPEIQEKVKYLFKKNKRLFLKSLKGDLFLFLDKRVLIKDLKIIEQEK